MARKIAKASRLVDEDAIVSHATDIGILATINGTSGPDDRDGTSMADTINGLRGRDTLKGGRGDDTLNGNSHDDMLMGNSDNDELFGGSGADTLNGGSGEDRLIGGGHRDVYVVENPLDTVIENANEGTDTVFCRIDFELPDNVENLTLTGSANSSGTGNALDNHITGNAGDNRIQGGTGEDTIFYNRKNDGFDIVFDFDGDAEGQDIVNLDRLLDSLNVPTNERDGVVAIDRVPNSNIVGLFVDFNEDNDDNTRIFSPIMNLFTGDPVSLNFDVILGTL